MTWIAGADGFRSQWWEVLQNIKTRELRARIYPNVTGLLTLVEEPSIVTVDIPIGLPEVTRPGGDCASSKHARFSGAERRPFFLAVSRGALRAGTRIAASQIS